MDLCGVELTRRAFEARFRRKIVQGSTRRWRKAAQEGAVRVAGSSLAAQALEAGLVDECIISIVPVVFEPVVGPSCRGQLAQRSLPDPNDIAECGPTGSWTGRTRQSFVRDADG
jgi:hypothetical protein